MYVSLPYLWDLEEQEGRGCFKIIIWGCIAAHKGRGQFLW